MGTPEAVVEGALAGARVAASLIDMSSHHGEHPRMGALDVCPFIPVQVREQCIRTPYHALEHNIMKKIIM